MVYLNGDVRPEAVEVPPSVAAVAERARRVAVLTGAGMSAESGIATFRDRASGLWSRFDPMTLATPQAFEDDPDLVWAWYLWRIGVVADAQPNAGHLALGEWERRGTIIDVVTQNVDDLHERAGSEVLSHVHGGLFDYRCFDCAKPWSGELVIPEEIPERVSPPKCACGGWVRPGIVWFGEMLPRRAFEDAVDACSSCDLMLIIGTSGIVQPAGSLPFAALERGVPVIEINPEESALTDYVTHWWQGTAAEVLPRLVELARTQWRPTH